LEFSLANLKHDLLAPGNIFWKKKAGNAVLISKKGEVLNIEILKKLSDSSAEIFITDEIDLHASAELEALYAKYSEEVLMRDKIVWREKFIECLAREFIEKENVEQFELNHLAWRLFSSFEHSEGVAFIERDADLFTRHLSVASSYTFCAFLLGYYEPSFLNGLFSKTLQNLMDLGASERVMSLKEKLEYLRLQESFSVDDFEYLKVIASNEILSSTVLFEKYNGSGPRNLNSREMSDLEVAFVGISGKFSFTEPTTPNILWSIQNGQLLCQPRVLKLLTTALVKSGNKTADALL
jgi:hypothetical protein